MKKTQEKKHMKKTHKKNTCKKLKNPNDPPRKPRPDGKINYHVLSDAEIDARRNPAYKYLVE